MMSTVLLVFNMCKISKEKHNEQGHEMYWFIIESLESASFSSDLQFQSEHTQ